MQPSDRSCPSSHSSSNPSLYPCYLGRTYSLFFSQCQSLHLCQEILASNFLHDFGAVISPSLGYIWTSLVAQTVKRLSTVQETRVQSLGWEDPLEKEWQPTPVSLPGKSHGQRNLVDFSPWGRKESTRLSNFTYTCIWASLVAQMVKNLPAMQETQV